MRINMIGKISNFQVYRHLFNENNISKVQSHILGSDGTGRTVDDVRLSVLKAIYENFEREELFNPRNVDKHSSILTIDKGKIINSDKSQRFSLLSKHEGHEMCDSSGVAAGQNSKMAIEHSFYEFIERQSLVYSFLTGRGGTSLKSLIPKDKILKKLNRGAYYINDISIVDNISVIIIIFSNTLGFSIGLGTDKDQKKAAYKAFNEGFGYNFKLFLHQRKTQSFNTFKKAHRFDKDIYEKYFYSNFSGDKLFEAYQFLGNARTKSNDWNHRNNYFEFIDILSASKQLNIPVNIEFLSSEKNIGKIVKTWSREAYPTIDNTEISPSRYKISFFEKEDPFFINKNEYLPFP